MSQKTTGTLKYVFNEQNISEKFKKREFIVVIDGQYPQEVKFELQQNDCSLIDKFAAGQEVTIHYHLLGRVWDNPKSEKQWFNTLKCSKIE